MRHQHCSYYAQKLWCHPWLLSCSPCIPSLSKSYWLHLRNISKSAGVDGTGWSGLWWISIHCKGLTLKYNRRIFIFGKLITKFSQKGWIKFPDKKYFWRHQSVAKAVRAGAAKIPERRVHHVSLAFTGCFSFLHLCLRQACGEAQEATEKPGRRW